MIQLSKRQHPDFAIPGVKPANTASVEIDWSNSISRGLQAYYLLNEQGTVAVNLVNRAANGSLDNGASYVRNDREGIKVNFDGVNDVIDCGTASRLLIDTAPNGSIVADVFRPSTTTEGTIVGKRDTGTVEFQFYVDATDSLIWRTGGNVDTIATSIGSGRLCLGATREGATVTGFVDGIAQTPQTSISPSREDVNLSIGARWQSYPTTGFEFTGDVYLVAIWGRVLSDAEHYEVFRDPYSLLKPKRPIIQSSVSAGGAFTLTADSGTYAYTGTTVDLQVGHVLQADSGTYSYTGTAADLNQGFNLTADSGTYTYSGTDATLTFTPVGAFTLTADSGAYNYTGTAAGLLLGSVLTADSGTYAYTGTNIILGVGINADTGAYAYTGTAVGFLTDRVLSAESGVYLYLGTTVDLDFSGEAIWTVQSDSVTSWSAQANVSTAWAKKTDDTTNWTIQ